MISGFKNGARAREINIINTSIYKYSTIEIDYSYLYKPINIAYSTNVNNHDVSIELKVKCGLKCCSPFLPCNNISNNTSHDIKFRYSRYSLMQLVKFSKSMKNGTFNCLPY